MKIIQQSNDIADSILGRQVYDLSLEYRPIKYLICTDTSSGKLVYNVMTKELVLLEDDRCEEKYLVEKWFKVPVHYEESALVRDIRNVMRRLVKQDTKITDYTILTTTECNARCFYCYEKDKIQSRMTAETAYAIVDYIRRAGASHVCLNWFGGEPLYNEHVIDIITEGLSQTDIEYSSGMISNGYLFDEDNIRKAISLWHLKSVQITLDGTEHVYNKLKDYIYSGTDNPFNRVIHNIELLLEAEVDVDVRLNLNASNYQDLLQLTDFLSDRFGGRNKCWVYTSIIYQCKSDETLQQKKENIDARLVAAGLQTPRKLDNGHISFHQCQADYENSILINPEGHLHKCEHQYDGESCGSVWEGITNRSVIDSWKEYMPDVPECSDCNMYPNCFRIKKCELNADFSEHCPEYRREKRESVLKGRILYEYEGFLKSQQGNIYQRTSTSSAGIGSSHIPEMI